MRITYSGVIASLAALIAVVVIAAHVALLISGFDKSVYGGAAYRVVEIGCRFDVFAAPLLLLAVALQGAAVFLVMRSLSREAPELSLTQRFQRAFVGKSNPPGSARNLFSTSSLVFVVFFVGQLSYMVNHCE